MSEERSTAGGDDAIGHPFDQTNGMLDSGGESDGTAQSDTASAAERQGDGGLDGTVMGDQAPAMGDGGDNAAPGGEARR
jgi:hypothetical protein